MYNESDVWKEMLARRNVAEDIPEESVLPFIRQSRQEIMDYCNIPAEEELPPGLFYVWTALSAALYWQVASSVWGGSVFETEGASSIKSVTEGDTTITFGGSGETATLVTAGVMETPAMVMDRYMAQLRHYRRLPQ